MSLPRVSYRTELWLWRTESRHPDGVARRITVVESDDGGFVASLGDDGSGLPSYKRRFGGSTAKEAANNLAKALGGKVVPTSDHMLNGKNPQ